MVASLANMPEGNRQEFLDLFEVESYDILKSLPPKKAMKTWYDAPHMRALAIRARQETGPEVIEILGHVKEGDDVAHVLFRAHRPNTGFGRTMAVTTLRTDDRGWWCVLFPDDISEYGRFLDLSASVGQ
jgi:hypothetical protein